MIADFHKKGNRALFNDKFLFKTAGIIFLLVISVLVVADFKLYQKKRELSAKIISYQKQIEDIKKSNQTLKEQIANADNVDYLEKLGYEQLDQTRPGETKYMFIKSSDKTEANVESENFWNTKSWIGNVWQWIKSKF